MRKNLYRLTYVDRGTYNSIAKELGYTYQYVQMVAYGKCRNKQIETKLIEAVMQRQERERTIKKLNADKQ